MEIIIAATKTCEHRPILEKVLQAAWLPYKVMYVEEHPEFFEKHHLKHSPLLLVDEKIESVGMPEIDKINELKARIKDISERRTPKRDENHMIPKNIGSEPGSVEVDVTWGSIQSITAAQHVHTVGELEVYDHHKKGFPIIDARKPNTSGSVTIPGSINIPYTELVERMDELDINNPSIFFCNGPQCPQSSTAIKDLLDAGCPADRILYYRGGMHDWITLGLPVQQI
ncbi:rhodanese-like domain-containing protein [Maribacter arcticus]|uniref:rhodanese-like domain-containing protein n=1 Tax=Maribacter arcticus TaxID=561365 RepID=UPI0030038255